MRYFIPLFLVSTLTYASLIPPAVMAYIDAILASLGVIAVILFFMWVSCKQKRKSDTAILEEKEEKITWLRRIGAENEHRRTTKIQELEKQIVEQNHTIDKLEQKLREGTKNQVVAKLEALQRKREQALSQAGMEK
jgi:ABC-type transport system involved in cytochrome bd biosynthesis fused ATPase/permease subunit